MPIILINKTAFETYFTECKTLAQEISTTNNQVIAIENQLLSEGFKKPNVKKLIVDAKKLKKPLTQVNFKSTSGNLSTSAVEVDGVLDTNIRTKLNQIFSKDISSTAVEPIKRKQLADKIKLSKNYGIPAPVFQKSINLTGNSIDFMAQAEVIAALTNGCFLTLTDSNVQIGDDVPTDEETDDIVDEASAGILD